MFTAPAVKKFDRVAVMKWRKDSIPDDETKELKVETENMLWELENADNEGTKEQAEK